MTANIDFNSLKRQNKYEERFMQCLAANDIEKGRLSTSHIFSVVGLKTFALLKDLISPKQVREVTLMGLLASCITDFLHVKENVQAERLAFRSRQEQSDETFTDYC